MFEKDIYQLIRGLRSHKGNEREYIQDSLKECRKEIKSQDMDQKATALLKLVYLEMFGHDMSWASFNVLEVMSSTKYLHKRMGYLAAVQSFRPETEVLMLAENLLKKDLNSADKNTMTLPLLTIPHVVSSSMANSLLTDLLPRLSHSSPTIRKKTIVTLYRLALVYPETLRPAWPKIKDRLQDENEDPSVTAAIVNVVCELGWRRPQDFLPLAPRLFELLTDGNNNWMAIKIIKLFSVLTPHEPRLVKKLLPPLTRLIKETLAMSVMYECINGIIQGGIMEAAEGTTEGDEIARLCVNKLRGMLVVKGDPNLRYVALLAFGRITNSHADVVSQHQDVILECIDDPDISIRTRALDLVVGMVNANNLQSVVERLLTQLRTADRQSITDEPIHDRGMHEGIELRADDDDDDSAQATITPKQKQSEQAPPLPDDYRASVIERILEMCSREMYSNVNDFEWYIGVLVELVTQCPSTKTGQSWASKSSSDIANAIGSELQNVAVRVKAVRPEAAAAAQSLLLFDRRDHFFPTGSSGGQGVLIAAAFIAGEYATLLPDPEAVLTSLLHSSSVQLPSDALSGYVQAIPKVFTVLTGDQQLSWTSTRQSTTNLFIARIVNFLEPLTLHPDLDIQERAVEYLDLMRLASEAVASQQVETRDESFAEPPLLLTQAIPALFSGMELNPVAALSLRKITPPSDLDLDALINQNLPTLLSRAGYDADLGDETLNDDVYRFYHERLPAMSSLSTQQMTASESLDSRSKSRSTSYQDAEIEPLNAEAIERKKMERRERYRDDPYYIDSDRTSGTSTPMRNILRSANGEDLDVDAIPVMELQLDAKDTRPRKLKSRNASPQPRKIKRQFEIARDETFGGDDDSSTPSSLSLKAPVPQAKGKKSLLEVDSSGLSSLSLGADSKHRLDVERLQAEEEEMARAMKEVERLRLEMQRAQEQAGGIGNDEKTVVRRKKKKKKILADDNEVAAGDPKDEVKDRKRRKKKRKEKEESALAAEIQQDQETKAEPEETADKGLIAPVAATRKKKRQVIFD